MRLLHHCIESLSPQLGAIKVQHHPGLCSSLCKCLEVEHVLTAALLHLQPPLSCFINSVALLPSYTQVPAGMFD